METVAESVDSEDIVARVVEIEADDEDVMEPNARENVGVELPELDISPTVIEAVSDLDLECEMGNVGLSVWWVTPRLTDAFADTDCVNETVVETVTVTDRDDV